ncbi:MAG: hypothetical protein L0Y56_06225 [Nitrospira sp.]|nr:hypothetical protein [Nitrospira sp.]
MSYARRSKEVCGFVNFPVNDPAWENTGEGGMFVRLVVGDFDEEGWMVCSGGYQLVMMDESFIGDDVHPAAPPWPDDMSKLSKEEIDAIIKGSTCPPAMQFHFPYYEDRNSPEKQQNKYFEPYASAGYLCALTIGSTGWSGYNDTLGGTWKCTYGDLTEEGKALYKILEKLYEGKGKIYLQTWLDT